MSIIFQLFNAEDLQKLAELPGDQLETLRSIIMGSLDVDNRAALKNIVTNAVPASPQAHHPPLSLQLYPKRRPSKPPPPQVTEALNKRFQMVSQQLKSSSRQSSFDFDELTRKHFNDPERDPQRRQKEEKILEWAISCEVNNYEFYSKLLNAKIAAYDFFYQKTGQRPKGPDSPYSPLHPRHPLYSLFYGLPNP